MAIFFNFALRNQMKTHIYYSTHKPLNEEKNSPEQSTQILNNLR